MVIANYISLVPLSVYCCSKCNNNKKKLLGCFGTECSFHECKLSKRQTSPLQSVLNEIKKSNIMEQTGISK